MYCPGRIKHFPVDDRCYYCGAHCAILVKPLSPGALVPLAGIDTATWLLMHPGHFGDFRMFGRDVIDFETDTTKVQHGLMGVLTLTRGTIDQRIELRVSREQDVEVLLFSNGVEVKVIGYPWRDV